MFFFCYRFYLFISLNLRCHPSFPKSESLKNRLYPKSFTKNSLTLKIPTSPESDGEIYLTPNTSVVLDDEEKINDSGETPPLFKVMKIQSMGNITNQNIYLHTDDEVDSMHPNEFDRYGGIHSTNGGVGGGGGTDISFGTIYRMKSMGNLSQYERSFGDTPKELLKLKEEFERRRFGLARRRSLTNLLAGDQDIEMRITDVPSKSIFTTKSSTPINGKYKKKAGIGDTKYIGNDEPDLNKHYHLTKMKSLGTIPDLVTERINYDPFLTPLAHRRHPASLHDYRTTGPIVDSNSSSSDGDDETGITRRIYKSHEQMQLINEINLLRGPFERGFRRSYSKDPNRLQQKSTTPLRQSDGYFQMPHLPVLRRSQLQRPISGGNIADTIKTRSSLHNLPTNGKIDVIRYALFFFCKVSQKESIFVCFFFIIFVVGLCTKESCF